MPPKFHTCTLGYFGAPISDSEFSSSFSAEKHQAALTILSALERIPIGTADPQVVLILLQWYASSVKLLGSLSITCHGLTAENLTLIYATPLQNALV